MDMLTCKNVVISPMMGYRAGSRTDQRAVAVYETVKTCWSLVTGHLPPYRCSYFVYSDGDVSRDVCVKGSELTETSRV